MLREIFYWIFNMSITASVTGIIVMLVRKVKKLPRRFSVILWLIPFLRMVFPFGLNSPYSLMTLLSKISTKTIVVYKPTDGVTFSMMNSITLADTYFPITYKVDVLENIFGVASLIWIIGVAGILLIIGVVYVTTLSRMKDSEHLENNIYLSEKTVSPAVYGIVKPRIILPASYKDKDTELVILHEKMHIRRCDNLWRILAFSAVAVHWFNPLCWIFLKKLLLDIELSCDETVLAKSDIDRRKEYALSLLESREESVAFASTFGGAKTRTRIENILTFKKLTRFSMAVFITFICFIFYVLMTNAG